MKKVLAFLLLIFPFTVQAENGIYLTLDSGLANQTNLPSAAETNATSINNPMTPPALRLGIGYNHDMSARIGIGLETGFGWYGKTVYHYADDTRTTIRSETSEYLLVGTVHVKHHCDLFAKAGGIRITPVVSGTNAPKQDTKIAFETVLGTAYNVNSNFAVILSYGYVVGRNPLSISNVDKEPPGLSELLLGVRYTFAS